MNRTRREAACRARRRTPLHCALLALILLAGCTRQPGAVRPALASVEQVRKLGSAPVRSQIPVRINGVLTFYDGASDYCFIQDSTGGIRVQLARDQALPAVGWQVLASGFASVGGAAPAITDGHIAAIHASALPLPVPVPVSTAQLGDPAYQYRRVTFDGIVRSVFSDRPGLVTLQIHRQNTAVLASVPASYLIVNNDWVDTEVQATGVLAANIGENSGNQLAQIWVSGTGDLDRVHQPVPLDVLPVSKVRDLQRLGPGGQPLHRVRLQGSSYVPRRGSVGVADETGRMPILPVSPAFNPAPALDVAGFVAWTRNGPVLESAVPVNWPTKKGPSHVPAADSVLTTALAVHRLPLAAAQRGYAARLRAVVTFSDSANELLFVQDPTDGIFIERSPKDKTPLAAGDEVEVNGVSTANFAPDIGLARVRVLGHPGLPAPVEGRFGSSYWGREDCRWVEFEGVVERVEQGRGDTLMSLAWGKNTYKAHVLAPLASLAHLVDSDVTLRGVCGALFNNNHQLLGIQMFLPGADCIRVLRPGHPDPFSQPPIPIADLLQFSKEHDMGHLARVQGTVTFSNRSGTTWIRDATGAVLLRGHDPAGLSLGDLVDVVGFPEIQGFGPGLRGSQLKRLHAGIPPPPIHVSAADALEGSVHGQIVAIEGKLVDQFQQPGERVLVVASGQTIFNAILGDRQTERPLKTGAHVRLTGICNVEVEQTQDLILPRSFQILLRSPADIVLIGQPPWLTADRILPILGGAALLMIAALSWVVLLRKRVRAQTFALRAQTVQLQAAHVRTRDALRKAWEATSLDLDSKRILEMIARDEHVELIVDRIAEAVALHSEGAVCAVLLNPPHGPRACIVPPMPSGWQEALEQIAIHSISFSQGFQGLQGFTADPAWEKFLDTLQNVRFSSYCAAPIVSDGATIGAIAAFFRDEREALGTPGAQLSLWANIVALALDRRRMHDQLSYRAQHDNLTTLPNRAALYERLETEINHCSRTTGLMGILYVDLDGFKRINDTYGHDAGDEVLKETARRLARSVRRDDTVARIGGDEFVVLLPSLGRREDAPQIADKIKAALREPIYVNNQRYVVSASVGIGIWPTDGDSPDSLLRFADSQMYTDKKARWFDGSLEPADSPTPAPAGLPI